MHIAIIGSRGYPSTYGGFETFVRRLAPWLEAEGHEVTVYGHGGWTHRTTEHDGIRVVETRGLSTKSLATATFGFSAAVHALRGRPDVVLVLNVANGLILPMFKAVGIPTVVNVDGIEWQRAKWGPYARRAFRLGASFCARFASSLVADSKEIARVWEREFRVTPTYIPYGADVVEDVGNQRIRFLGLDPGGYALVVARLVPENNVEAFLDALESLEWRIPAVIVGSANYENPLEERLRACAESGRIHWLGHVGDQELLGELWGNAGVYFHGHSVGGTNPALLQALGHGAPTVAVDTPYNREVLGNTQTVVAPNSTAVAEAIQTLMSNTDNRGSLAEGGRARIDECYRWESVLESYESLFRKLEQSA